MNSIRNLYGKGSSSQDVNSGNIHDSVMDPQISSDSGSACEHSGLPVLQMMSVSTSWNFGSVGITVTKDPEVKVQGEGICTRLVIKMIFSRGKVESLWWFGVCTFRGRRWRIVCGRSCGSLWICEKTPPVLSHIRFLSGYSWNWKPCSSRKIFIPICYTMSG